MERRRRFNYHLRAEPGGRHRLPFHGLRFTQAPGRPQAALGRARQDAIRSTQYADTPPALAYLLLSPTINGLLIRSSLGGVLPGRYAERSRPTNT